MKQEVNNTVDESMEKLTQDWDKWKRNSIGIPSFCSHTGNSMRNESTIDLTLKLTRQHTLKTVIENHKLPTLKGDSDRRTATEF